MIQCNSLLVLNAV